MCKIVQILISKIIFYCRTCEPLSSPSLSITCQDSKRRGVSCYRRVSPGTRANLICKEGYQQLEDPGFYSIKCEEDGIWDKCPFSCQPGKQRKNNSINKITNKCNASN